jgi:hypothetical protein
MPDSSASPPATNIKTPHSPDSSPEVKAAFRLLAKAIDQVGDGRTELFLAKLAILLADKVNDQAVFEDAVVRALR